MKKKILLWGGTAKTMLAIQLFDLKNYLIFDPFIKKLNFDISDGDFSNNINQLKDKISSVSHFFVCLGGSNGYARSLIASKFLKKKLKPLSLIHKKSIIDKSANLGQMLMVMPGAIINPKVAIGDFCVINTASVIEHDCILESGVTVMGSACVTGNCTIKENTTIGTNSTIFPNLTIGKNSIIGSGSLVNKNVKDNNVVLGNPARFHRKNNFLSDKRILFTKKILAKL